MKTTGFTIVRNAVNFDYPVVESIKSALPICDEFIVSVGNSNDETLDLVLSINSPKIKVYQSIWDDNLREGGKLLSVETNKALNYIDYQTDWILYLQADEVIHEKFYDSIHSALVHYKDDFRVQGLLFNYVHFYGSYHYIGDSRKWYRKEIRIIRNDKSIQSWGDAQGFRNEGKKLNVKQIDAEIYHYGWVKNPYHQKEKQKSFHKMWHTDEWMKKNVANGNKYDYDNVDSLAIFLGTHPAVMTKRIESMNWEFKPNLKRKKMDFINRILYYFEKLTGLRLFEYRNYKKI